MGAELDRELDMELRSILQAEQSTRKSIPQPSQSPSRAPSPISNFYATNFPSDGEGSEVCEYPHNRLLSKSLSLPKLKRSPTKVVPEIDRFEPVPRKHKKRNAPPVFFQAGRRHKHNSLPALVDADRGQEILSQKLLSAHLCTMPAKIRQEVRMAVKTSDVLTNISSNSSGRYNQVSEKGRYTPGHSSCELSRQYSDGPVHMNINMPKVGIFDEA